LIIAVRNQNPDIVSKLLEKNADVNVIDKDSNTPLIDAINGGNTDIINLLLEKNADLSKRDKDLNTPLMVAVSCNQSKNDKLFKYLIKNGANIYATDLYGNSALMYACTNDDFTKIKYLIKRGININIQNNDGDTALMQSIKAGTKINNEKIIDILLEKRADVDHQESQGNTALHYAARQGNIVTIEKLIKSNANLEIRNYKQETPI
ncbi:hypothetical protein PIROE2DRAFT_34857, partial [Piromyces sp. E2]